MEQPGELNTDDFESPSSNTESEHIHTPIVQSRPGLRSASSAVISERTRPRKQPNPIFRPRQANLQELRRLCNRTDNMIPKLSFGRLIRELLIHHSREADKISSAALCALQEASEAYITQMFQDSYACTMHRGRVTLTVKDMELVRFLRSGR